MASRQLNSIYDSGRLVAVRGHEATNHLYDDYLPYEFHLRMVVAVGKKFFYLLTNFNHPQYTDGEIQRSVFAALWNHDRIEDTRATYNNIVHEIGQYAADIVYAVTDEKGKTRKERHGGNFWPLLRATPNADFVKMSDRIANVQYGAMTGGSMFQKYREENPEFIRELGIDASHRLYPMAAYLQSIFDQNP